MQKFTHKSLKGIRDKKFSISLRWCLLLSKTLPQINLLHSKAPSTGVQEFISIVNHGLINHGVDYTLKLLKAYKLIIHQFALKQTITPIPFCITDKDGFPKILKPWKITKKSSVYDLKYIMTIWRCIDLLRIEPRYEISTIVYKTQPDENLIDDIINFMKSWNGMKLLGSKPKPGYFVMSTKAGPNGPASLSCLQDLSPLREDIPLYNAINDLMDTSVPGLYMDDYEAQSGKQHSKLVLLSDKAGKTRVVAIADWWSNTALSGIHKTFLQALRKLETDMTFRQSSIPEVIKSSGKNLYSADMTAFTDVFPRKLEKELINTAWPGIGDLWETVTCERDFTNPHGNVRYATGNPMGLLSSWPVSSFTHHCVKQYCAHVIGIRDYKYILLGDDSLDTNIEVHKMYLDVMTRLGVSISLSKCTQSETACAEFAKRLFLHGEEITGLPVDLIAELDYKPEQFIELVRIGRERGYTDTELAPGIHIVASKHKNAKILLDILALPESATDKPPLLEVMPGSWAELLTQLPEESVKALVRIARESEFIDLVTKLEMAWSSEIHVKKNNVDLFQFHPIIIAISNKLMLYIENNEDEFSIYNSWMEGNYREMAHVPSLDIYRVRNKGHFSARCKYKVLQKTMALANGNCNINLQRFAPISNFELFERGFPKQESSNN
jgi:hypothetical protein